MDSRTIGTLEMRSTGSIQGSFIFTVYLQEKLLIDEMLQRSQCLLMLLIEWK
jgi:hypothetical protein